MTDELILITESQLIAAMRRRAQMSPDLVYRRPGSAQVCRYLPGGANPGCGCLVGSALSDLKVSDEILLRLDGEDPGWERTYSHGAVGWATESAELILTDLLTEEAIMSPWVVEAQDGQDYGRSWAQAVAHADREATRKRWVMA